MMNVTIQEQKAEKSDPQEAGSPLLLHLTHAVYYLICQPVPLCFLHRDQRHDYAELLTGCAIWKPSAIINRKKKL